MPITAILENNAKLYGKDTALVEINPQELEKRHTTWREYSLIEPSRIDSFRSEMNWAEFDQKSNRLANFLLT
ncbi:MAG: long-chain fatty acid--CoA ligase, partial [Victivallaceae bacterium]|nr:long-chain fatty acid--CoA ligase [Victivallaceae bacterium]